MFNILDCASVPILIFSAGIGDILLEVVKQDDLVTPNVQVISNFMEFNEEVSKHFAAAVCVFVHETVRGL